MRVGVLIGEPLQLWRSMRASLVGLGGQGLSLGWGRYDGQEGGTATGTATAMGQRRALRCTSARRGKSPIAVACAIILASFLAHWK